MSVSRNVHGASLNTEMRKGELFLITDSGFIFGVITYKCGHGYSLAVNGGFPGAQEAHGRMGEHAPRISPRAIEYYALALYLEHGHG